MLFLLLACGGATPAETRSPPTAPEDPPRRADPGLTTMAPDVGASSGGIPAAPGGGGSCDGGSPLLAAATWGSQAGKPFVLLTVDAMDPGGMHLHGPLSAKGATVEQQDGDGDHVRAALTPDGGVRAATVTGRWRCGTAERDWTLRLDLGGRRGDGYAVPARIESSL